MAHLVVLICFFWVVVCAESRGIAGSVAVQSPPLDAATLERLAHAGIAITFRATPVVEYKPIRWGRGVLFITHFDGKNLQEWMKNARLRPSKVVLIDDRHRGL